MVIRPLALAPLEELPAESALEARGRELLYRLHMYIYIYIYIHEMLKTDRVTLNL